MKNEAALKRMSEESRRRAWAMRSSEGTCWKSLYSPTSWRDPVPRFYWTVDDEAFRVRHRDVTYYLLHGLAPDRLIAVCGNPRCVNPGHMAPKWTGGVTTPGDAHSALLEHPVLSQEQIFTQAAVTPARAG